MLNRFPKSYGLLALSYCLLLLLSINAFAQQQTGELLIKVADASGAVISGAKITLTSPALIRPLEATSDTAGVYRALALPPGIFKVTVANPGFRTTVRDNVRVEVGRIYPVEVTLQVGTVAETVEVAAGTIQIDTVKSEASEVLSNNLLLSSPGGRDFSDYVRLLPSVNNESMAAGISVNGASGAENVFYVDGVNTSNMYGGESNQTMRTETVQELQVKSGGYEAEFGGAQGGVVSVVTKSGSNSYHGEVYYYYGGSKLNGGERRTLRLDPNAPEPMPAQYITYKKDTRNDNEFGVSLGGPIFRDKAWFFLNANPTWNSIERNTDTVDENLVVHNGIYRRNQLRRSGLLKLEYQPFQKVRLFTTFTQDTYRWKGKLPNRDGTDAYEFEWSKDGYKYPSYTFNGGATITLTPKFLVDTRYGFNALNTKQLLGPSGPTWRFGTSNSAIGYTSTTPGYRPSGWYNQDPNSTAYKTVEDMQKKLLWNAVGSLNTNFAGQHNFKFGYNWDRWVWDTVNAHPFDYVRLFFGRSWTTLDGVRHASSCVGPNGTTYNPCGYVEFRSPFGDIAKIHTDHQAFFFQDSWTIKRRLTINPGLRFEKEEIPSFSSMPEYQHAAMKWGFGSKIAPRFGAAYDLFGNGKAKVSGYWGRYYDQMKLGMAEGSFGGFKWHSQYYLMNQSVAANWQQLGGAHAADGFTAGCTGSLTGGAIDCSNAQGTAGMQYLEDRDWRIPSFDTLDPDVKPMRSTDIGVGTEVELKKNYIFSFNYVRTNLDRTIEDVGVETAAGEMYYITNPGFGYSVSKFTAINLPPTPKAKRTYNAWTFRLRKPMSQRWMGDISYTYSRLYGNYAGLASSDEDWGAAGGRNDPNVERYFDQWYLSYDASGRKIDGPLNTDRPHQIKLNGRYQLPHNLPVIGAFFQAMSGTPITRAVTFNSTEWYVNNRVSDGRTPFFTQTDLYLVQTFKPFKDESKSIQFNANILNLFNQETVTRNYRLKNRNNIALPSGWTSMPADAAQVQSFFSSGFDWQSALAASQAAENTTLDPRFGMDQTFQGPIQVRFGVRFIF